MMALSYLVLETTNLKNSPNRISEILKEISKNASWALQITLLSRPLLELRLIHKKKGASGSYFALIIRVR